MNRRLLAGVAGLFLCLLVAVQARSQSTVTVQPAGNDSLKSVHILNADSYRSQEVDSITKLTFLVGHVRIQQEKTLIECDSLIMNNSAQYIECFDHVHINDNDSVNIYSDYMKYLVDQKMIHFQKNVRLTDGKGVLTTEALDYDLKAKIGTYDHGGKVVNKESTLTSEQATYYEDTKDVHFRQNVVLRDPQYDLSADSLLYNTQTQVSTFITETFIQFKDSSHRTIRTKEGYYDLKNKKAQFGKRPVMTEGAQQLTGETVQFDDSTGFNIATGSAVYIDTTQGIRLIADYMAINKKNNTFLATKRPLLILKQDKDSLYVSADTLKSARLVDAEADQRRLAHEDSLHRIYVDSLEKISADSLHRVARARATQDSLAVLSDTVDNRMVKDLSDSLGKGVADSLGREGLDSLHRLRSDTSGINNDHKITDNTGARSDSARKADSAKAKRLTPRQLRRQAKAVEEAKRQKEKDLQQAVADSLSDIKHAARAKIRAAADSVKASERAAKARVRFLADSVRKAAYYAKKKAEQDRADSIALAHGDSSSLRRADSLANVGKPPPIDSVALRRAEDSARAAAINPDDSASLVPARDTSLRYIMGFHNVRIYSDSLQAVADSLYYSAKDSIFRLYYNPVAWGSGNYQVTGDTMYVYTKDKKAKRLYVFENALAINKMTKSFYNQLKGTTINCYFDNGQIDYIRAKGNAESIYYIQDDNKAYTGANRAHADIIDMIFVPKKDSTGKTNGKELNRVVLRNDAEGSMVPMKKVIADDMLLRGFKWLEDRRPKSKEELFLPPKQGNEEEEIDIMKPRARPFRPTVMPHAAAPPPPPPTTPASKKKGKAQSTLPVKPKNDQPF